MAFFAIIDRDGALIPIIKGGEGPDANCMATWDTYPAAYDAASQVPISNYGAILIFDTENQS